MSAGFTIFHEVTEQVEILGLRWAVLEPKPGAEGGRMPSSPPGVRSSEARHQGGCAGTGESGKQRASWAFFTHHHLSYRCPDSPRSNGTRADTVSTNPCNTQASRTEHCPVEEHVPWRAQSGNFQDGGNIFPGHILLGILKLSPLECTEYVWGAGKPVSTHPKGTFSDVLGL